jgi:hypothetical protein
MAINLLFHGQVEPILISKFSIRTDYTKKPELGDIALEFNDEDLHIKWEKNKGYVYLLSEPQVTSFDFRKYKQPNHSFYLFNLKTVSFVKRDISENYVYLNSDHAELLSNFGINHVYAVPQNDFNKVITNLDPKFKR